MEGKFVLWNPKAYVIDFDKVNTLDDLKIIIKSLNITIYENYSEFDKVKDLLKEIPEQSESKEESL